MRTQHLTALCLIICVLLSQTATALKCYACVKCNDPFKKDEVKTAECSGVCLKSKALIDAGPSKEGDVERACMSTKMKRECNTVEKEGEKRTVCHCDKDLCNDSYVIRASIATGIVTVIAILKTVI